MHTKIKICGITNLADAQVAAEAGADFLGYIFWAPSKRFIAPRSVTPIVSEIRRLYPNVQHVGVFVDEDPAQIAWIRNIAHLDMVQLHGHESPSNCKELAELGIPVIKTFSIGSDRIALNHNDYPVDYYLCDTHDEKLKGGTGRCFAADQLPGDLAADKTFIAGGLTPDNVQEMIVRYQPYAIDVSTGVEISPGVKSHPLIKQFISNARKPTLILNDEGHKP